MKDSTGKMMSRGQSLVLKSLRNRRMSPKQEAEWYCQLGVDKSGFALKYINDRIGYGVVATVHFEKGSFLMEYRGRLCSEKEGTDKLQRKKNVKFPRHYVYFFRHKEKTLALDATDVDGSLGRLVNDSVSANANCKMKKIIVSDKPHLVLFATKNIEVNEELRYDYGDPEAWWRNETWARKLDEEDAQLHQLVEDLDRELKGEADEKVNSSPDQNQNVTNDPVDKEKIKYLIDPNVYMNMATVPENENDSAESNSDSFPALEHEVKQLFPGRGAVSEKVNHDMEETASCGSNTVKSNESNKRDAGEIQEQDRICQLEEAEVDKTPVIDEKIKVEAAAVVMTPLKDANNITGCDSHFWDVGPRDKKFPDNEGTDPASEPFCTMTEIVEDSCEGPVNDDTENSAVLTTQNMERMDYTLLTQSKAVQSRIFEFDESSHATNDDRSAVLPISHPPVKSVYQCPVCLRIFKKHGAFKTHFRSHDKERTQYKRRIRQCPLCDRSATRLTRHFKLCHKDDRQVHQILKLPKSEQRKQFALLRNQGILMRNKAHIKAGQSAESIKVSKDADSVVHCRKCDGAYSRRNFRKHRKRCEGNHKPLPAELLHEQEKNPTMTDILSSFHNDETGKLIRKDSTIQLIGGELWNKDKTKVDKSDEVRKGIMSDMRKLGNLYKEFRFLCPADVSNDTSMQMFNRENWTILRDAIERYCQKDETSIKYGLKNNIYYLLMNSATILEGIYLTKRGGEEMCAELSNFKKVLKHHQNSVFGDAKYLTNKARQERLRLPNRLPDEHDMDILRMHTQDRMKYLLNIQQKDFSKADYIELRNLVCSRLTLFNGRRGGEPARVTTNQWLERSKWLSKRDIDNLSVEEKLLNKSLELFYLSGKGNHLVSCMIPEDTITAMDRLTDGEIRQRIGISVKNQFLFPSTREKSCKHVLGWCATATVCEQAGLKKKNITATSQRHRLSTIYAAVHCQKEDRQQFYSHLGHSKEVNEGTYQRPLPWLAKTKVGTFLQAVDKGQSVTEEPSTSRSATAAFTSPDEPSTSRSATAAFTSPDEPSTSRSATAAFTSPDDVTDCSDEEDAYIPSSDAEWSTESSDGGKGKRLRRKVTRRKTLSDTKTSDVESSDEESSEKNMPIRKKVRLTRTNQSGRAKWSSEHTNILVKEFDYFVNLPSPAKALPGKELLSRFLGKNKELFQEYSYLQVRTKLMNEQKKTQAKARQQLNFK